ncbi:MAG: complex I NDUFA9 subunit family protein [Rhodospirillales bacterium]|nr:complex I NDUFA9 subunit family protein [Rhodospirillales bacterium]
MRNRIVTVFGGSGFIGRHLVQRLAERGAVVRVAVRDPEDALYLKPMGEIGQIVPMAASVTDPASIARAVAGADAVVNLVGILSEWGKRTFQRIHVEGAKNVAEAAAAAGARSLIHVSALGADPDSPSAYARTKAGGEAAVKDAFPGAVIIRPGVIFGPEDNFFNLFAGLTRFTPVLPVFGCPTLPKLTFFGEHGPLHVDIYGDGGSRMQPVYVGDVAEAIAVVLDDPSMESLTLELGGPGVYSYKALMELLLKTIGRRRLLLPYPFALARMHAWFLEKWPTPLITRDQLRLLERDNVVAETALGFKDLGLKPKPAEAILPTYLKRFRPVGQPSTAAA